VRLFRESSGAVCITVSDTGIGFDKDYVPRLLEPFSQEDSGYTRRFEGAGLGLALSRRYLELNGASLTAHSDKGVGSIFTICFAADAEQGYLVTGP
jgi:signal transduction histidine kinase